MKDLYHNQKLYHFPIVQFIQWGKVSKGTKPLPISYTTWYVPVVAYGNNQNWQPENSAVTAYQTSLSQLNIYAKEGAFFWFITIGK